MISIYAHFSIEECAFLYFFSDYFAVSKLCYTFVAVKRLAISYQGNDSMQGNLNFFATFCTNNLVVPNNLLLSLSLSLSHRRHANNYTLKFFLLRAREACRNPCKQRTFRSFLCSLFYTLL